MKKKAFAGALITGLLLSPVFSARASNDPGFTKQWGMSIIGAPTAWTRGTGAGITIAIIDTGIDLAHEDLKDKIVQGHDYIDGDDVPQDENGHGTHVSGIAAASTGNGLGVAGVAPGAKIMPIRVLDKNGTCSTAAHPCRVEEAIVYAVQHGAQVINMSLGDTTEDVFGPDYPQALQYAWDNHVICVVAAGNDILLSSGYASEPAIIVSATDRNDAKPDYSSGVGDAMWGMAAPGGAGATSIRLADLIYSTYWTPGRTNDYDYDAGTSMSAPHVAGAAAVLRGLGLTPQQTVDRLLSTAKDIGAPGRDSVFGAGRLDLAAATAGLVQSAGTAPSGGGTSSGSSKPGQRTATSATPSVQQSPSPVTLDSTNQPPGQVGVAGDPGTSTATAPPRRRTGSNASLVPAALLVLIASAMGAWWAWKKRSKKEDPA